MTPLSQPKRPSDPSLRDLAAAAGLSTSTVSRYLAGTLTVKSGTESRIRDAIADLGYDRRSRIRRNPSTTPVIGLVIPNIGNPYFATVADRIVEEVERRRGHVIIGASHSQLADQNDYVALLAGHGIDGLLYLGNYATNTKVEQLVTSGLPVVAVDERFDGAVDLDTVTLDDYSGAFQATSYLLKLGHINIALVSGPRWLLSVEGRFRGYSDALERAGIDAREQFVRFGEFSQRFGESVLAHLLAQPDVPSAVFACSDTIAIGLMHSAKRMGIAVPGSLSVVGFDDVDVASYLNPALTTVHTPLAEIARRSVAMLAERINGHDGPARHETVPVSLIVRESCGHNASRTGADGDLSPIQVGTSLA